MAWLAICARGDIATPSSKGTSSRSSKASKKKAERSPFPQKPLDSCVAELNDASELTEVGHYNSEDEKENKQEAKKRYNMGKEKRAEMLMTHESEMLKAQAKAKTQRLLDMSDDEDSNFDGGNADEGCSLVKKI